MSRTHKDLPSDGRALHSLLCPGHGAFDHDPRLPDPEDCFFCSVPLWVRAAWHLHVLIREIDDASKKTPGLKWVHWLMKPARRPLATAWTTRYLQWHAGHTLPDQD